MQKPLFPVPRDLREALSWLGDTLWVAAFLGALVVAGLL